MERKPCSGVGWGSRGRRWSSKSPSRSGPRSLRTELKSDLVSVLIVPVSCLGCVGGGGPEADRDWEAGEQGGEHGKPRWAPIIWAWRVCPASLCPFLPSSAGCLALANLRYRYTGTAGQCRRGGQYHPGTRWLLVWGRWPPSYKLNRES